MQSTPRSSPAKSKAAASGRVAIVADAAPRRVRPNAPTERATPFSYHTASYIDSEREGGLETIDVVSPMSEWKTRITKVQVVKPKAGGGEACLVLIYPPG